MHDGARRQVSNHSVIKSWTPRGRWNEEKAQDEISHSEVGRIDWGGTKGFLDA